MKQKLVLLALVILTTITYYSNAQSVGLNWKEMGPFDIGGREYQITYAPSHAYPYRCFVATVRGIYRSLDYRTGNWSICGGSNNIAGGVFGAIVQDRNINNPDYIYAASGFFADAWNYSKSQGIYYSLNGGDSWSLMQSTNSIFDGPTSMIIDNQDNLLVSSTTPTTNTNKAGLFQVATTSPFNVTPLNTYLPTSFNGLLPAALDLEINPSGGTNGKGDIYATSSHMSASITNPSSAGHILHAIFDVNNNINSWADLTPSVTASNITNITNSGYLATTLASASTLTSLSFYWIYCTIGTTSTGAPIIYLNTACTVNTVPQANHPIFTSTDGGTSWKYQGAAPETYPDFYNSKISADKAFPDVVYTGGYLLDKGIYTETVATLSWTTNGNLNTISKVTLANTTSPLTSASSITGQEEQREVITNLRYPGETIITNDGGLFYSNNNTQTNIAPTFTAVNGGFNTSRFIDMDLNQTSGVDQWIGASQDNGIHFTSTNGTLLFDKVQDQNAMGCLLGKTSTATTTYAVFKFLDDENYYYQKDGGTPTVFNSGIADDPNLQKTAFDWDSKNGGTNYVFTAAGLGKFGRFKVTSSGFSTLSLGTAYASYTVSCVKIDPTVNNAVWLGLYSSNGVPKIVQVTNADGTFAINPNASYSFTTLPNGAIPTSITFEGTTNTNIAICFTNTISKRIWTSTYTNSNIGISWTNIDNNNLPASLTINDVLQVPASSTSYYIYAATSQGLWYIKSTNGTSTNWSYESNLPYADVRTIRYRSSDQTLAVGTYSGGVWMTKELYTGTLGQAEFDVNKTNPDWYEPISFYNTSWGNVVSYLWDFGDGSTSTLQNPPNKVYSYSSSKSSYTVSLTLTLSNGFKTSVTKKITFNKVGGKPRIYSQTGLTLNWTEMGPFDLGGRINDIIYAPNAIYHRRAFIATKRGIYRSLDYQLGNWQICGGSDRLPNANNQPTNNVFCSIVRSKNPNTPETFYACTGFYDDYSKVSSGIYYSTDGGESWTQIQQTQNAFEFTLKMEIDQYDNLYVLSTSEGATQSQLSDGLTDVKKYVGVFKITNPLSSSIAINNVLPLTTLVTQPPLKTQNPYATNPPTFEYYNSDPLPVAAPLDIEIGINGDIYVTTTALIGSPTSWYLIGTGRLYVSKASGTNRSTVGTTWQDITPPDNLGIETGKGFFSIQCALTAANTNIIYLSAEDLNSNGHGIIIKGTYSSNGNINWVSHGYNPYSVNFLFNTKIIADQTNELVLYSSGLYHAKSTDGGQTWVPLNCAPDNVSFSNLVYTNSGKCDYAVHITGHADSRIVLPNPNSGYTNETLACTDGGIFYSSNNPQTSSGDVAQYRAVNSGLNNSLIYFMDINPKVGTYDWVAGAQDNGDFFNTSLGTYMDVAGDGMTVHYDKTNAGTIIYSYSITPWYPGSYFKRKTNAGATISTLTFYHVPYGINYSDWDSQNQLLYVGESNGGMPSYGVGSFAKASLTHDNIPITVNGSTFSGYNVTCIKVDPNASNVIWIGLSLANGNIGTPKLIKVTNANNSPTDTDPQKRPTFFDESSTTSTALFPSAPIWGLSVNSVILSNISFTSDGSNTTNKINVCFSNVNTTYGSRTFFCDNLTSTPPTWYSGDGNTNTGLPSGIGVKDMVRINTVRSATGYLVIAGTNNGVWVTNNLNVNGNTIWQNDANLPGANVTQICYRANDNTLALSTFGEGIWMTRDALNASYLSNSETSFEVSNTTICPKVNSSGVTTYEPVYFYNTSIGDNINYSWDFKNGTLSTVFNPPPIVYSTAGTYTVKLTNNNTGASASKTITVATNGSSGCPVTPININKTTNTAVATLEDSTQTVQNWRVYPNPSAGIFFLTSSNAENKNIKVTIYDMSGKVAFQSKYANISSATRIEMGNRTPGIYSLVVEDDTHVITTKKILIAARLGEEEEEEDSYRRLRDKK